LRFFLLFSFCFVLIGYDIKVRDLNREKKLTRDKIEKSLPTVFCMDIQAFPTKKSGTYADPDLPI
jgi:hypothetical protein